MIKISEIFYSIQGESVSMGLPFIFVRFAECNLRCNYCDAKYSYKSDILVTKDEIMEKVQSYLPEKRILFTGGEPLLQNEIYKLFEILHTEKYDIYIETNGSLSLKNVPSYVTKIVDVKCPDSGEGDSFLYENLKYVNLRKDQIKFVISSQNDYVWAKTFILKHHLKGEHILFSAAWGYFDYKVLVINMLDDKLDVRFQPQIHKFIWHPDKRGV